MSAYGAAVIPPAVRLQGHDADVRAPQLPERESFVREEARHAALRRFVLLDLRVDVVPVRAGVPPERRQ